MREFIKIALQYVKPYKYDVILNISLFIFSAIFSLFSLALLIPFLGMLFDSNELITIKPEITFSIEAVKNYFYYFVSNIIIAKGKIQALTMICVFILAMIFFKNLFLFFGNFFMANIRNGIIRDIRDKVYNKTLKLPLGYFSEEKKGDIISRMTSDVQEFEWSAMSSIEMLFQHPIQILVYLISLIFISPSLTLFIFVLLPIMGFIIGRVGKSLKKKSVEYRERMGLLLSIMEETLSGLRIIKAFAAEKKVKEKFNTENNIYTKIAVKIYRREYLASPLSEFLGVLALLIVIYYGASQVLGETSSLSPDVFIGYIAIFSQIIQPAKQITTSYYRILKGLAAIDRINHVLDADESIKDVDNPINVDDFNNKIEFKNVSFKYAEAEVLKNINITVEKGKSLALVGQSGSGKSTLVDLIPRFYDIQNGEILIDNNNIKNIKIHNLRSLMGNVNQESILFNDTIFNNIAFGVEKASQDEVIAAAKVANAHDFILETENGYQTNIGDRGSKLSGGQRQRLSIARAVLKNPPILILDEATSALDTESERLVQDALTNLMKNRTSIVIAHRLSTIKHADEICVLNEGEIVERGSHDELITKNGVYKKLHDLQMF